MSIADDLWDKGYLPHAWTEDERNKVLVLRKYIKELETKNRRLREALGLLLSNVLLGALSDDEIVHDWGALGLDHVQRARKMLEDK